MYRGAFRQLRYFFHTKTNLWVETPKAVTPPVSSDSSQTEGQTDNSPRLQHWPRHHQRRLEQLGTQGNLGPGQLATLPPPPSLPRSLPTSRTRRTQGVKSFRHFPGVFKQQTDSGAGWSYTRRVIETASERSPVPAWGPLARQAAAKCNQDELRSQRNWTIRLSHTQNKQKCFLRHVHY